MKNPITTLILCDGVKNVITYNFRKECDYPSPKLYARRIWQILFNIYRDSDGNLDEMSDLLCDYNWLTEQFEKYKDFRIYWSFYPECGQTFTHPYTFELENCWKVEYNQEKSEVTITLCTEFECDGVKS